jgi:hypothetical protein
MSDTPATQHRAHVVVHPVADVTPPFRRVDVLGTQVGKAYCLEDVVEFMRRAGLDEADHLDSLFVEWQGGGPDVWE